ncbi:MAG: hypothetical protein WCP34_09115, partial [Pseudomonadota bacterium]
MEAGELKRPQYLDQPARLFSKDSPAGKVRSTSAEINEHITETIGSRKHTQLAEIGEEAAIGHINELVEKYHEGARIAEVPSNQRVLAEGLARLGEEGERLHGRPVLVVPEQHAPVPRAVLEVAERAGVIIRDPEGRVYDLQHTDGHDGAVRASARDPEQHADAMREELLRHVPPEQREQFADVNIHVLREAEYRALTHSESGPVVTLISKGEPIVVIREGTDIGVCALVFHSLFVAATDAAFDTVLPALGSELAATWFKWSLGTALILPQSILLGMTFPLMSGGLIRRHPGTPGASLAMLYFTNSLGAAVGVLASGFFMIEKLGLPGTIQAAGAINLTLALAVWLIARGAEAPAAAALDTREAADPGYFRMLLATALLTGTASFIYEIGWIRMLSLVLGASTHSFELMLSAFIFGLACGGYWVKRRIDATSDPTRLLGIVQVVMGLLAIATLPLYGVMFDVMTWIMRGVARTETGYVLYHLSSHAIALAIMFPATFCAGMTLPLITYALLRRGYGEKSIGAVYAANTLGAIIGVFAAAHLGMPLLGLKNLVAAGAAIDTLL